ncbi:hypothetical protein AK830_g8508 [Neonectria ditissima]|uniref:Uncharacterized protein n=1 Tax=Neonectria ditissima TaxID=78410 RepID=A0A0P7BB38_9HYPO|nr:hypothetical protein AK830_g8508 [Neonectria ditissima]
MASKKDLAARVFGHRLSRVLLRSRSEKLASQRDSSPTRRPHSSPVATPKRQGSSLRQRFWTASSSNYFQEEAPDASPAARASSPFVPRHAASDFSKNANGTGNANLRADVDAVNARISRRFSNVPDDDDDDDDERTLCSFNCRDEPDPEQTGRDLETWLATLNRQQALPTASSPSASAQLEPLRSPLRANPPSRRPRNLAPAAQAHSDSDAEYGVFAEVEPSRRRSLRASVLWADIERTAQADPVLHPRSTYSDPEAGSPGSASLMGHTTLAEFMNPSGVSRTRSERRRTAIAKAPRVATVMEM